MAKNTKKGLGKGLGALIPQGEKKSAPAAAPVDGDLLSEIDVTKIERRKDHACSPRELKEIMLDAQKRTYGDGLDPDLRHPYMWACKSHYYYPGLAFYNFPYAFGQLFGAGVFAKYQEEGASFVPKYNQLLRSCGSGMVADVAMSVGIDVRSVDFWRASLKTIEQDIDLFVKLADEQLKGQ